MLIPEKLKYSKEHEWIEIKDDIAYIGITDFAQKELGDIVFLDINTIGKTIEANAVFGAVEAVKTVSDLFLPISGEIIEINPILIKSPELINTAPYESWIIKLKPKNLKELDDLLSANDYEKLTQK